MSKILNFFPWIWKNHDAEVILGYFGILLGLSYIPLAAIISLCMHSIDGLVVALFVVIGTILAVFVILGIGFGCRALFKLIQDYRRDNE
jgi:hypothetical protein